MLSLLALSCPQCSAPLPRAARWRTVNCSYCGATIMRSGEETVERESFRAALRRANANVDASGAGAGASAGAACGRILTWRGARYRVLAPLATGEHSEVLLAERLGALPERVTLQARARQRPPTTCWCAKAPCCGRCRICRCPARPTSRAGCRSRWAWAWPKAWATATAPARPWCCGTRPVSGAACKTCSRPIRQGIDARHAVWIWRRMLEVLAFVHGAGWTHREPVARACAGASARPRRADHRLVARAAGRQCIGPCGRRGTRPDAGSMDRARAALHGGAAGEPGEPGEPGLGAQHARTAWPPCCASAAKTPPSASASARRASSNRCPPRRAKPSAHVAVRSFRSRAARRRR
jgi:hypothetical protein